MASKNVIARLRAGGIVVPKLCVAEAARAGLRLELAAALLEKESGGGHNVFGHDRDKSGKYIFPARDGTVKVTKELYLEYKRRRVASGDKAMQGVGPCQLTWFSFQDDADKLGGCWKAQLNIRVGFGRLAGLVRAHGDSVGARMYNGSGPDAEKYSADLLKRAAAWKARLAGAAPAPVADDGGPLQRGDRGQRVARLTRKLSKTRSKDGKPYLAKPRQQFGPAVESALKAFQADHRLEADGVYGPVSQRKLNRVHRLQQSKPVAKPAMKPAGKPVAGKPVAGKPAKRQERRLKPLVAQVLRYDAEAGEAWEELVGYAARRRKQLARVQAKAGAGAAGDAALRSTVAQGFEAVTAALKEIDGTLDTIVAGQALEAPEMPVAALSNVIPAPAEPSTAVPVPGAAPPSNGEPLGPENASATTVVTGGPPPNVPGTATITKALPLEPPPPEGPAPPSPAAVPAPRRELTELSDEELLERIERLDRALDRTRAVMIKRFAAVEKDLAVLAPSPAPAKRVPKPPTRPQRPKPAKQHRAPTKVTPTAKQAKVLRPKLPSSMPKEQLKDVQRALNWFTEKFLKGLAPLIVDGEVGPATRKRIKETKFYLGYTGRARKTTAVDQDFMKRLRHPKRGTPAMVSRGVSRRREQRKAAKASAMVRPGVALFDGKPVAAWLKPYLDWARKNGWQGTLNSGWRDPVYSEKLCQRICGAPSCPGRCAGRTSNHAGSIKPAGAVDVSDYARFGQLMARCPLQPRIHNALGAQDPVHFSVSGR